MEWPWKVETLPAARFQHHLFLLATFFSSYGSLPPRTLQCWAALWKQGHTSAFHNFPRTWVQGISSETTSNLLHERQTNPNHRTTRKLCCMGLLLLREMNAAAEWYMEEAGRSIVAGFCADERHNFPREFSRALGRTRPPLLLLKVAWPFYVRTSCH